MADREDCERIAAEMRKLGRLYPYWNLSKIIEALLDAGIIQLGPEG